MTANGPGVVASGHPLAAAAGRRVLREGGGAGDAVLAMAFTQWVVNAPLCGPGGDMFLLHVPNRGSYRLRRVVAGSAGAANFR